MCVCITVEQPPKRWGLYFNHYRRLTIKPEEKIWLLSCSFWWLCVWSHSITISTRLPDTLSYSRLVATGFQFCLDCTILFYLDLNCLTTKLSSYIIVALSNFLDTTWQLARVHLLACEPYNMSGPMESLLSVLLWLHLFALLHSQILFQMCSLCDVGSFHSPLHCSQSMFNPLHGSPHPICRRNSAIEESDFVPSTSFIHLDVFHSAPTLSWGFQHPYLCTYSLDALTRHSPLPPWFHHLPPRFNPKLKITTWLSAKFL